MLFLNITILLTSSFINSYLTLPGSSLSSLHLFLKEFTFLNITIP